ncbi:hypothetical protein IWQ55_002400 [Labrenzia sp. EL_208]|nr:hypothetical protein [Labrenzia sp. EL_132]MBG6229191.1 hypothetical protein [Labrenzia sp. EL_208]
MRTQLAQILRKWDGKDTALLEHAYSSFATEPDFAVHLVELCETEGCERGATWLLKHRLEKSGDVLPEQLATRHVTFAPRFVHWEARLHFLQYFGHLQIPENVEHPLEQMIDNGLTSENKFVRAWSHYALAEFALRFPAHRSRAIETLERAGACETAGSVKVRIRKALEKLKV